MKYVDLPNKNKLIKLLLLLKQLTLCQVLEIDNFDIFEIEKKARGILFSEINKVFLLHDKLSDTSIIVDNFFKSFNEIKKIFLTDLNAAFKGDPSALDVKEIALSYPGLDAIFIHRIAHELYLLKIPYLPRIMSEYAHSKTGIDIHPGATIGNHFFIDHGTGVVIGETTLIGNHVRLYQGVTLGALSLNKGRKLRGKKRHPTIGNNVIIYANASILGGQTIIEDDVTIGANCLIIESVKSHQIVCIDDIEQKTIAKK